MVEKAKIGQDQMRKDDVKEENGAGRRRGPVSKSDSGEHGRSEGIEEVGRASRNPSGWSWMCKSS